MVVKKVLLIVVAYTNSKINFEIEIKILYYWYSCINKMKKDLKSVARSTNLNSKVLLQEWVRINNH